MSQNSGGYGPGPRSRESAYKNPKVGVRSREAGVESNLARVIN